MNELKTQNLFSDSFRFKNPILDFLKETHTYAFVWCEDFPLMFKSPIHREKQVFLIKSTNVKLDGKKLIFLQFYY